MRYSNLEDAIRRATRSGRGFTLIELLTVIAIIAVLALILFPAVNKVRETANKAKSASNMRQIALAQAIYTKSGGRTRSISRAKLERSATLGATPQGYAEFLAKNTELTEASLWIIDSDPALNTFEEHNTLPTVIGYRDDNNSFQLSTEPAWDNTVPVGYTVAVGQSQHTSPSTTPLLWTRGLTPNGTWTKDSPWGKGGHIAFLDGHVAFYNELSPEEGQFVNKDGTATANYLDLFSAENILEWSP